MRRTLAAARAFARQYGGGKTRRGWGRDRICNRCEFVASAWRMRQHITECYRAD